MSIVKTKQQAPICQREVMQIKSVHRGRVIGACLAAFLLFSQAIAKSAETSSVHKTTQQGTPINVIFDTDMHTDLDDALALAMLHSLQRRGEARIVAVTISTDDRWSAPYVDLVNTYYGRSDIPIGVVRDGLTVAEQISNSRNQWAPFNYVRSLSEQRQADGRFVYRRSQPDRPVQQDATALLRRTLAVQPDQSVVLIQVGFSTNLARLLQSAPDAVSPFDGRTLVHTKVRLLSVMSGNFLTQQADGWNIGQDVAAAQVVFSTWPSPIVASGGEIGAALLFPSSRVETDFRYAEHHPIAVSYRAWSVSFIRDGERKVSVGWPHDHPTWDLTSVLYAIRPMHNYFGLSDPGTIVVEPSGVTRFEPSENGNHRHLVLSADQKARAIEAMVLLTSEPP